MDKKGDTSGIKVVLGVALLIIVVIAVILAFRGNWSDLIASLTGTKEKVIAPLQDIDFSKLTETERERVIEEAVERDAEAALDSANKLIEQGDYENAKRVLGKLSSDAEGRNSLLEEVDKKIQIINEAQIVISSEGRVSFRESMFIGGECSAIPSLDISKDKDSDDIVLFKKLLKQYYTAKCYYARNQNNFGESVIDSMKRRYPNHEITIKTVNEFSNQKT